MDNLLKFGTTSLCNPLLPVPIQFSLSSSRSISMASLNSINPHQSPPATSVQPSVLVFSGGTAFNGVVEELKKLTTCVAHVLPVSDDGGSTAEIVRVLGGPAVGDIRSRCLRLSDQSSSEALAVRTLLGYRLPLDAQEAKLEWYGIVEGEHLLWKDVSKPYRETIRAFLAYFQNQILRRTNESFCFSNGRCTYILSVFGCCNIFVFTCFSDSHRKSGPSSDIHQRPAYFGV